MFADSYPLSLVVLFDREGSRFIVEGTGRHITPPPTIGLSTLQTHVAISTIQTNNSAIPSAPSCVMDEHAITVIVPSPPPHRVIHICPTATGTCRCMTALARTLYLLCVWNPAGEAT